MVRLMRLSCLHAAWCVVALVLAGCSGAYLSPAASHALAGIKVGMTREEVVSQLGPPHAQATFGKTELLTYRPDWSAAANSFTPIGIADGKVVGFGPTYALKVELNFKENAAGK